jgi:hypothetical protein
MCDKCNELRQRFQDTDSITDREIFWKEYDAQHRLCNPGLGKASVEKKKVKK